VGAKAPLPRRTPALSGEPAHALNETALDLADVDGRVQGPADVMEDVDAGHPVLARERIDDHLEQAAP
jgi:hypothetical protein